MSQAVVRPIYLLFLVAFLSVSISTDANSADSNGASGPVRGTSLFDENFQAFTGSGLTPAPAAGQLDSTIFRVTGLSDDSDFMFGESQTGGDFARGSSTGNVSAGGIYAFEVGKGNVALGIQPGGSDFTPGTVDIRLVNTTGSILTSVDVAYQVLFLNNENRSNSLNFSWSTDDSSYTPVPALDFATPGAEDASPFWDLVDRSTTINGLSIPPDGELFLRWSGDDVSGSGSRDEYGLDNILVTGPPPSDIALIKAGPADGLAGQALTYAITIANPSPSETLSGVTLTDTLPIGLTYASDTSGVTPTLNANTVEWSLADLPPGGTISFDLVVNSDLSIADESVLTNQLSADAVLDGNPVNQATSVDTTFRALVTINDIQQVVDPSADDDSPLEGQRVWTEGIVTSAPGELNDDDIQYMSIQGGTGAYSGLIVRSSFSGTTLNRGDQVRMLGNVDEVFGLTMLVDAEQFEVLGSGSLPAPELLDTSNFSEMGPAASEPWEGVLIEFQNVEVTEELIFGEWRFDDGSGIARGDDLGSISFTPSLGDEYGFLRGIGWFSFGNYKVQPRDNDDIEFETQAFTIQEIQGADLRSPFAPKEGNDPGDLVRTLGNVVTAVATNGFFIQAPDPASDSQRGPAPIPPASRGLFVFTSDAPSVDVGDIVDVEGPVVEFFNLTQIANPDSVDVVSTGNPLPTAIVLNDALPSTDPQNLSCISTQFECYENMLVTMPNGFVTAPNQSFGTAPIAEAFVSADGNRILREPGAVFPGILACPSCPIWSGAPELFEMDPRRFDVRSEPLIGGTSFSATGIMGFAFGDYVFWPTVLDIPNEPALPDPAIDFELSPSAYAIAGSLNALNLFDDTPGTPRPITACGSTDDAEDREVLSTTDYETKLNKLAVYIVTGLGAPDVLALQEVESEQVLQDLADEIELLDANLVYSPRLIPGNDRGNINNGFLINEARIAIDNVEQLAADECLTVDNSPLHDRPPLLLRARLIADGNNLPFAVYNLHMRSLGGIDNPDGRTRLKRHEQAQSVAQLVQNLQTSEPNLPIIVIGDMNAFEFTDGYADVVGHLRGTADPSHNFVSIENAGEPTFDDSNIPDPILRLPLETLPPEQRYSFIFDGVSQALDHALLDDSAWQLFEAIGYSRANADYWEGFEFDVSTEAYSSDHDGLVIVINTDRLFSDSFETP